MTPATTVRLALAGDRADVARLVVTAAGAAAGTLVLLALATVLSIPQPGNGPDDDLRDAPYANPLLAHSGLRPGLCLALVILAIPFLFFVAQCGRLGAPARDRRLAAYRLGGASPGQTAWIATTGTGLGAAAGAVAGLLAYLAGRVVADAPDAAGVRPLPTDVLPPWWALVLVMAGVPALAAALSLLLLRPVTARPFGVVRRLRDRPVRPWPFLVLLAGVALVAAYEPVTVLVDRLQDAGHEAAAGGVLLLVTFAALVAVGVGLALSGGWFAYVGGRLLRRLAHRPAGVLAAHRLLADPWAASRAVLALVPALLVGSLAAVVLAMLATEESAATGRRSGTSFLTGVDHLVGAGVLVTVAVGAAGLLVLVTEQITTGRRALASLVATGTPRATLLRALLVQTAVPLVPAVVLATAVAPAALWFTLDQARPRYACPAGAAVSCVLRDTPHLPFPWADLTLWTAGCIAAALAATALGAVVLRASTDVAELRTE